MAMTYRQLMNSVLGSIGSAQIPSSNTTITDTYQLQVATFMNQIKEEVEDAWNWRALWTTYNINFPAIVQTTPIVDITTGAVPNERSRTVRWQEPLTGREIALCFDVTSFGIPFPMEERKYAEILYKNTILNQSPVAYSTDFAIDDTGGSGVSLVVYPGASQARTIQLTMCTPVPRLDFTVVGNLDLTIAIPTQPIEFGTIWYALQERGEELGTGSVFTEEKYRNALDDAITRDIGESGGLDMVLS